MVAVPGTPALTKPGVSWQLTTSGFELPQSAISAGKANGAILLDAGSADDGRSDLSWGLHCQGQLNPVVYCRVQVSAVTSVKFEIGFTDVISGTDAGAVGTLATPSFNAADFVGWVFDTDDTANPQCVGVDSGTAATKIETSDIVAPTAATYQTYIVAIKDGTAFFYQLDVNGRLLFKSTAMLSAVTSTVNLTPWVFLQNRSASQRTMLIDTLLAWQRRTAS